MAALRAAVFPLSAKNRRGGHFLPPPSSARVKIEVSCEVKVRSKVKIWRFDVSGPGHQEDRT